MPSTKIRGQTRLWLLVPTGHPETDEVVIASDLELQEFILKLLEHYRRAGLIRKELDLEDMTMAIFAVFYHHYLQIGVDRSVNVKQVRSDLSRRVALLFEPWNVSDSPAAVARARAPAKRSRAR